MATVVYQNPDNPVQKGKQAAEADEAKQVESGKEKIDTLIKTTNNVLISARSMLDIFPDQIDVEATRIILTYRQFLTTRVHTVDIENITEVLMQKNVLYTNLTFFSRSFVDNTETISKLRNSAALQVKKIIDGLKILSRNHVDASIFTKDELLDKLKQVDIKT